MGWRYRKSIRLGGGVRLNLSKSGIGVSAGVKGFRVGVGPRGGRVTASIPGTGIGYTAQTGTGRKPKRPRPARPAPAPPQTIKPSAATDATLERAAAQLASLGPPRYKSASVAAILWLFLGLLGGHRYYLGLARSGAWQTLTLGGFGVWWLLDLFRLGGMVRRRNYAIWQAWLAQPLVSPDEAPAVPEASGVRRP